MSYLLEKSYPGTPNKQIHRGAVLSAEKLKTSRANKAVRSIGRRRLEVVYLGIRGVLRSRGFYELAMVPNAKFKRPGRPRLNLFINTFVHMVSGIAYWYVFRFLSLLDLTNPIALRTPFSWHYSLLILITENHLVTSEPPQL